MHELFQRPTHYYRHQLSKTKRMMNKLKDCVLGTWTPSLAEKRNSWRHSRLICLSHVLAFFLFQLQWFLLTLWTLRIFIAFVVNDTHQRSESHIGLNVLRSFSVNSGCHTSTISMSRGSVPSCHTWCSKESSMIMNSPSFQTLEKLSRMRYKVKKDCTLGTFILFWQLTW